jgi:CRP-like cAMP-binding protein
VEGLVEAVRHYRDGEVIVREGDPGNEMFLIITGEVKIVKEKGGVETVLAFLKPGEIFGEMALVQEGAVRSATAKAHGDTTVLAMDKAEFLRQIQQDPELAFQILKSLCERLRAVDEILQEYSIKDYKRQENIRNFIRSRGLI